MPFNLPTFNLMCRIRRFVSGPYPPGGPVAGSVSSICQLRPAKWAGQPTGSFTNNPKVLLVLPAGTDIRMIGPATYPDLVEVPQGSGLWYTVWGVWDSAKGFTNETRQALLSGLVQTANMWVYPQP